MRKHVFALTALSLVFAGCGTAAPVAQQPPPSTTPAPPTTAPATTVPSTTSTSAEPTTTTANPNPPAPPSSKVRDCFDGDCTLLLSKPTTIPLDAARFHYASMRVTAISADGLTFSVTYPQGGGAQSSIGPGLGGASFGFRGSPSIEVGLTLVDGKPALVLQPGPVT
ncbi:hypothetical protein [Amycolatopsis sp. ATCC 39116]|uniref:hypothetical protein n=1 Tax=Amycolatopsis sp. (strain ATCC 39116 / 75iv2) TaxID=385957 RepID=UPI0012FCE51A|nr:hypothetical protein [Amycolatopsis sp. ATCC 39116]